MSNINTVNMPLEVAKRILRNIESGNRLSASIELRREIEHPQFDPTPYLWYDPENGDTWTQEAVDEGFCATDSLIPLYTKDTE